MVTIRPGDARPDTFTAACKQVLLIAGLLGGALLCLLLAGDEVWGAGAGGQEWSPYTLPPMDYCAPIANPYGQPIVDPACDVTTPGAVTYRFGTVFKGQPDAPHGHTYLAHLSIVNSRPVPQRVVVRVFVGEDDVRWVGLTLGPSRRLPVDLQNPVWRVPDTFAGAITVTFLDGDGVAGLELWEDGPPFHGRLITPTATPTTNPLPPLIDPYTATARAGGGR